MDLQLQEYKLVTVWFSFHILPKDAQDVQIFLLSIMILHHYMMMVLAVIFQDVQIL